MTQNKSISLQILTLLMVLDGAVFLFSLRLIPAIFNFYIAYKIWNLSKWWRNFTVYIRLPLGCIFAIMTINQFDYSGEFMLFELLVYAILFIFTWYEFDDIKDTREVD